MLEASIYRLFGKSALCCDSCGNRLASKVSKKTKQGVSMCFAGTEKVKTIIFASSLHRHQCGLHRVSHMLKRTSTRTTPAGTGCNT
ncbi:hypothetical protein BDA96_01G561100 [Sorghum bicolor]|uniref:Uncharacterized protein n=1 Tax=Sorghum bicolor TaxID=4558 RepID=A0A921S6K8_SORBI|nr:hypothetical protein BDA96_01G561100 [Sorghum bicolor]